MKNSNIPKQVKETITILEKGGFEAYIVGGCVRDLLGDKEPKDWDVTTNAKPEEIQDLFEETFYENDYGTVGVVTQEENIDPRLKVIEITPYRLEAKYSNNRHPDSVTFSKDINDDLKRRDFTINAIAYNPKTKELVDLYGGQEDIKKNIRIRIKRITKKIS